MRTRTVPVAILCLLCLGLASCARGCGCGRDRRQAARPEPEQVVPIRPNAPESDTVTLREPNSRGARRLAAPAGGEIVSLDGAPDGAQLVAATSKAAFVLAAGEDAARAIEIPGFYPVPKVVAMSGTRAAVLVKAPTEHPEGRVFLLDTAGRKVAHALTVAGVPAFGAALSDGRLAIVLSEPAKVLVIDAGGAIVAEAPLPAEPRRMATSRDRTWAAIACAGGVAVLDASATPPAVTRLAIGPGSLAPEAAVPVGDAWVLVAGKADADRPFAVAAPRAAGPGAEVKPLPVSGAAVVGAAVSEDGARALVFAVEQGEKSVTPKTHVFDTSTWQPTGTIAAGPYLPAAQAVTSAGKVLIPACRDVVALDPQALTSKVVQQFPAPETSPCLVGLYGGGDRLAARDGGQAIVWRR